MSLTIGGGKPLVGLADTILPVATGDLLGGPASTERGKPVARFDVEDVTADWATAVLSVNFPGVRVTALDQLDVTWGASGKVRVRLGYNQAGARAGLPELMIVKGGFGRQPGMSHMYGIEVTSFARVVPTLDVASPKCFFAGEEPKAQEPMLLLEDLCTRDVRFNNALRPLTFAEAQRHLEAMARFHASWWGSEALHDDGSLGFLDAVVAKASIARLGREEQPDVWGRYMTMPRGAALPTSIVDPERLFTALKQLWVLNRQSTFCIIHNDCHIGNTYVYPDGSVGFLDWAIKRGPWYKDVAYFLVSALEIDKRRAWEQALISYYLSVLDSLGCKAPAFADAWYLYRCELIYSLTVWTCNGDDRGQFQNEAINTACAVRAGMAVLDHGSIDLLT